MNIEKAIVVCLAFTLFACKAIPVENKDTKTPKNVILLISDGTGLSQISSAYYFKDSSPNYSRFKNIGLIKTSSSKQDVTDSAAGATAFASGIKTYNGAIGVADDKTDAENIVEIVSRKNIKTGLVATSSITHATPASFYAHAVSRGLTEDIAADLVTSEVDFFAGGGLKFFKDRKDGKKLLDALNQKQFSIYTNGLNEFSQIQSDKKVGYLLSDDAMPTIEKGRGDFLSKATAQAIQFLDKDKAGFFLMSEGSQIDWGGHSNNASYLISELIDFDDAIGQALDYAEKDGNTLVIVTSDHETGGFTLSAKKKINSEGKEYSDYTEIGPTFSTGGHSATLIPVFAYGPGSEEFNGVYENNLIFEKILQVTKWNK
ncbi:alkaline phosphatase [Cellulophaga sp. F20128]|uniref:alkaline phosphatase n=1 Tax=Cellulophaga sp. F20128 TaxID=2926413 RepID=UPI001FF4EB4F|nr:alkaline phosphatase [Cellulophaga sp. F20128]MCK0156180.1 alkaline phosphatase [Cellulophaga sp. F20128]